MIKSTELQKIQLKQFRDSLTAQPVNSFPKKTLLKGLVCGHQDQTQLKQQGEVVVVVRGRREMRETQDAESGAQRCEERTLGERIYTDQAS